MQIKNFLTISIILILMTMSALADELSTIQLDVGEVGQVGTFTEVNVSLLNATGSSFNYSGIIEFSTNSNGSISYQGLTSTNPPQYFVEATDNGTFTISIKNTLTEDFILTANATTEGITANENFQFLPGSLNSFNIEHEAEVIAGNDLIITINAVDSYNNILTGFNDYAFWKLEGVNQGLITFTSGVATITLNSEIQEAKSYSLELIRNSVSASSTFIVNPATLDNFEISHNSFLVVNNSLDVQVTAKDAYNNTVTNYTSLIMLDPATTNFVWSEGSTQLENDYQFITADYGTVTLSLLASTLGDVTLTINDPILSISSTSDLSVVESSFSLSPTNGVPGDTITVTGNYFMPGTTLTTINLNSTSVILDTSVSVPSTGSFTTSFVVPIVEAGVFTSASLGTITEEATFTVNENQELTVYDLSTQYLNPSQSLTKSITLSMKNTGNVNIQGVNVSITDLTSGSYLISSDNISINLADFDLAMSQEQAVLLTITIPSSQELGSYSGSISVEYDGTILTTNLLVEVTDETFEISIPTSLTMIINEGDTETTNFNVVNTGTSTLSSLVATYSGDISSVVVLSAAQSLSAGATGSYTITVDTTNINDGTYTGTVTLSNNQVSTAFPLTITVRQTKLVIRDLDITVNSESSKDYSSGETISNVKPDSVLEFDVELENKFSNEDFEQVLIRVLIENIDDGDDIEEESSEFNINEDDKERQTVNLNIPEDVTEGLYDVIITIEGEDEDGDVHEDSLELKLEIDKDSKDINIVSFEVFPETIVCQDTAELEIKILNAGRRNSDYVIIEIESSDFDNYEVRETNLELNDGDSLRRSFTLPVPSDLNEGIYAVSAKVYFEADELTDIQTILIAKDTCGGTSTSDDNGEDDPIVIVPQPPTQPGTVSVGEEESFIGETTYVALLTLVGLLLIIIIILLFRKL